MKFKMGQVVSTPGALDAMRQAQESHVNLILRHGTGDWGDLCAEDKAVNDYAVESEQRILSAYTLSTGVKVYVITEADRSATTFLLPSEY